MAEAARPSSYRFADDGIIPNHPHLPLLVHAGVLGTATADRAAAFEALFARHGWGRMWRNGIYGFHHYHSTAHEVLGIAAGVARVRFGGEHGTSLELEAGDAVLIPAGVGHRRLDASGDLLVVGAYPAGQRPDLCRGRPAERPAALASIRAVPLPERDPVTGRAGAGWSSATPSP
jgi:uncharacterized protein YjlB